MYIICILAFVSFLSIYFAPLPFASTLNVAIGMVARTSQETARYGKADDKRCRMSHGRARQRDKGSAQAGAICVYAVIRT
jgi:hypothetical protein